MSKLFKEPEPGLTAIFNKQYNKPYPNNPHGWRVICWGTHRILYPKERFHPSHYFNDFFTDYQSAVVRFFATLDRENIPWQAVQIHFNGQEASAVGEYWQVTLFNEIRFK